MPMDLDYVAGCQAIEELKQILSDQPHCKRERITDDIILFVKDMKKKYKKK